ncbi:MULTISPECIES: hypothetical protein [unclassified Streptomyces]|nr:MULTISPECIES: hypothetical protein [unclassified Streptomyces]
MNHQALVRQDAQRLLFVIHVPLRELHHLLPHRHLLHQYGQHPTRTQ